MSNEQIKLVKIAQRELGLDDGEYRLVLRNIGNVESCKSLTQRAFEDVMAFFESRGFQHQNFSPDYWQGRVQRRGRYADPRQVHHIEQLVKRTRYSLAGLCLRFSDGRVDEASKLRPDEAHRLIEMLKSAGKREQQANQACLF